jgi:WD40 repeat protein
LVNTFQAHSGTINRIKQSPYNGYVTTVSSDNTAKVWSIVNGNWIRKRSYRAHTNKVYGLEYINKETIATGSSDQTFQVWSLSSTSARSIFTDKNIFALQQFGNGSSLAIGLQSGLLITYNLNTGNYKVLYGHSGNVNELTMINDNVLASAGDDRSIRIWDLIAYTNKFTLYGHGEKVYGLKLVSSKILASASKDKTIKLWDLFQRTLIRTLYGHDNTLFYSIDMLNDGQKLVSGSLDEKIKLWDISSGGCLNEISTGQPIQSLAVLNFTSISNHILS